MERIQLSNETELANKIDMIAKNFADCQLKTHALSSCSYDWFLRTNIKHTFVYSVLFEFIKNDIVIKRMMSFVRCNKGKFEYSLDIFDVDN